jgi:hypothetical protein
MLWEDVVVTRAASLFPKRGRRLAADVLSSTLFDSIMFLLVDVMEGIARVVSKAFGVGLRLRVEGDRSGGLVVFPLEVCGAAFGDFATSLVARGVKGGAKLLVAATGSALSFVGGEAPDALEFMGETCWVLLLTSAAGVLTEYVEFVGVLAGEMSFLFGFFFTPFEEDTFPTTGASVVDSANSFGPTRDSFTGVHLAGCSLAEGLVVFITSFLLLL